MSHVNHDFKSVFIHVPKTGGSSMERNEFVGGGGHGTIHQCEAPVDYFKWGFVRNPFDRLLSFHCAVWQQTNDLLRTWIPEKFEDLAMNLPELTKERHRRKNTFIRPQVDYLCDKDNKILVDFVGKFEHLQRDWKVVCKTLGETCKLKHRNKTKHKPWLTYYTKDSLTAVYEFYREDFETFYRSEPDVYNSTLSHLPSP